MSVLAVDIGGTKVAAGLVEADGSVHVAERVPTGDDPWPALCALLERLVGGAAGAGTEVTAVGIGCGGPMQWPEGVVAPLNIREWRRGFPLRERVSELLGLPVRLHNDAICFAAGEHWMGAGRGFDDVLGVVVSTGVGGGLVLGGRIRDGRSGNAGHVGHVVVEPDGPLCGCGGRGCLEAVARGPAVVAWAAERGCVARDGVELAELARRGDAVALAAFARSGRALGVALAGAAALVELDAVVVGGGLASVGNLLFEPARQAFAEHARLSFTRDVPILPSGLGAHAGLIGAAALAHAGERYWWVD